MASVKFKEGSEEWKMFADYWMLCKKFWEPEETEEYWESVIDAGNAFLKKHNTPFTKALFWTFHDELERKLKENGSN